MRSTNDVKTIDYKDIEMLKKFLDQHARIMPRKQTGMSSKSQRKLARAIKRARFLGLLPYISK